MHAKIYILYDSIKSNILVVKTKILTCFLQMQKSLIAKSSENFDSKIFSERNL